MRRWNHSVAKYVRWALIAPVLPMSIWMSMMGLLGLGFGAGSFMLGYILSTPAFFLNIVSPRWGAFGAFGIVLLDYVPRVVLNWPEIDPLHLLTAKADGMLILNLVLSVASTLAWEVLTGQSQMTKNHVPE